MGRDEGSVQSWKVEGSEVVVLRSLFSVCNIESTALQNLKFPPASWVSRLFPNY